MMTLLLILSVSLFLGLLGGKIHQHVVFNKYDFIWATVLSSGCAIIATWWSAPQYLDFPYFESDFIDYCKTLITWTDLESKGSGNRSRFAGLIPWFTSQRLGILNGLAYASFLSTGLIFGGLYLWGVAAHSRLAGVAAVGIALSMTPLVGMSRILNFYPEIILTLIIGAWSCTLMLRHPKPWTAGVAGLGIALCLLIDVRGLIWALSFAGLAGLALLQLWNKPKQLRLAGLYLLLPIYCSWFVAWWSYPTGFLSLESQIDIRPMLWTYDPDLQRLAPPWNQNSSFVWGKSSPFDIPQTLQFLWDQRTIEPGNGYLSATQEQPARQRYNDFWQHALLFSLAFLLLLRRPLTIAFVLLPTIPFLSAFAGTQEMGELQMRFYAHGLPAIALLGGVAFAATTQTISHYSPLPPLQPLRIGAVGLFFIALSQGSIPSRLAPQADWRPHWNANTSSLNQTLKVVKLNVIDKAAQDDYSQCASHISQEAQTIWFYEWGRKHILGDNQPEAPPKSGGFAPPVSSQVKRRRRVDINTDSFSDLESIPRIGPTEAQAIYQYRQKNGNFTNCRQLFQIPNLNKQLIQGILPYCKITHTE